MPYLAYKFVILSLMLNEVNMVGPNLGLSTRFPIMATNLEYSITADPKMVNLKHLDMPCLEGRIDDHLYAFAFSEDGRLWSIWKRAPFGGLSYAAEINDFLAHQRAKIGTNYAYRLATNWLTKMSVNVRNLEEKYPHFVRQESRWKGGDINGAREMLPLFEAFWGELTNPVVQIEIDGRTKDLIDLRLNDDTVSERPVPVIINRLQLEKLSDNEFLAYSGQQRSNLIARFVRFGKKTYE